MGYYEDYFRAPVTGVQRLSPSMIRIAFGGDADLARFVTSGFGDERLCVVLPRTGEQHTVAPTRMPDATLDYPEENPPEIRSYTVRRWDPTAPEMIIDFVAHEGGAAATWAGRAKPGDVVYLSPASGWHQPPADAPWQLLVADLTGLPALGRIVEELPAGARAHCLIEVAHPDDLQRFETAAEVTYEWVVGGNGHSPSRLLEALRRTELPTGAGYLWFAGEAAESRAVRKYLRRELGWATESYTVLGYWRFDKENWERRYDQIGSELESVYEQAIADGNSAGDALEIYDEALERAGL